MTLHISEASCIEGWRKHPPTRKAVLIGPGLETSSRTVTLGPPIPFL
jgi:hypothetical protein